MEEKNNSHSDSFLKKIILICVFFLITPIALFTSIISLIAVGDNYTKNKISEKNLFKQPQPGIRVYASLPPEFPTISERVVPGDARPEIIRDYLKINKSPLEPYADYIVEVSDKYNLDFRLITAIAQKESGLCRVIPQESYNCWGWGIHSQGTLKFNNFAEGIETVSKGLKENYIDKGYKTVEDIMKKYAHPNSTTWAEGVSYYMKQME